MHFDNSHCIFSLACLHFVYILSWVDAHTNLLPEQGGLPKSNVARRSNQAGASALIEGDFFLSDTSIAEHLLVFYRETDYQVHGPEPFSLKVGLPSEPLRRLFKQHRCDCAAFITACNPYSQKLAPSVNVHRHLDLMTDLASRSLIFIEGIGIGQDPDWPGEASCLIFGLALEASRVLGHKFNQNAIVWCDQEAMPELVLLR